MGKIKELIRIILSVVKRKPYKQRVNTDAFSFHSVLSFNLKEYFFGYYDRTPECNGVVLMQEMNHNGLSVNIVIKEGDKMETVIAESKAFNWQMGARAIWIDEDTVSYNDFDGKKYICCWYSLSKRSIIKEFDKPLQDYSKEGFFLGVNYQRLRSYAKEYAYYCLPEMSEQEYNDYDNDGIWMVDVNSGETKLLLSIAQLLELEHIDRFVKGKHFVNHIMLSPSGKAFIFIHRYYVNGERFDRLMYYDFKNLKCLMNERIQSHYCWLDDENIFGYGEYREKRSFNACNVVTGTVTQHEYLTQKHPRDGHPTVYGDWIAIDNYPDLSRMQSLILYNYKTQRIYYVGEFYHDLKHKEYNRCDLHPRFTHDGKAIYIDTIYTGKRELCKIDVDLSKL